MSRSPVSSGLFKITLGPSDALLLWGLFNLAYGFRLGEWADDLLLNSGFFVVMGMVLLTNYVFDTYNPLSSTSGMGVQGRLWAANLISGVGIAVYIYAVGERAALQFGRGIFLGSLLAFSVVASFSRYLALQWARVHDEKLRWLAVGKHLFLEQFKKDFKGSESQLVMLSDEQAPHQGTWEDLEQQLQAEWSGVVVCTNSSPSKSVVEQLLAARMRGVRVYSLTDFYQKIWLKVPVYSVDKTWLLLTQGFALLENPIGLRLKRLLDVLGALLLTPLALPFLAFASLVIWLEDGSPVIFRQTRTGLNGEPFTLFKLRTMRKDAEKEGAQWAQAHDARATWVGHLLRKTRIDELPQIWNVLKGDMSFIGPRPERPEFNERLEKELPHYNLRHVVRPGITGWAQVLYPYGASVEDAREKLQYELYYIINYSLFLDLAIVIKTIRTVLFGRGR